MHHARTNARIIYLHKCIEILLFTYSVSRWIF